MLETNIKLWLVVLGLLAILHCMDPMGIRLLGFGFHVDESKKNWPVSLACAKRTLTKTSRFKVEDDGSSSRDKDRQRQRLTTKVTSNKIDKQVMLTVCYVLYTAYPVVLYSLLGLLFLLIECLCVTFAVTR